MWQTTADHTEGSAVALPEPDSPLPDLPDLKNAAMSAASFAASSSPSPALMAAVACAEIAIDILKGFLFWQQIFIGKSGSQRLSLKQIRSYNLCSLH